MTVYVDDMYRYPMGQFGRMKMSHMMADTEDELHEMAAYLGLMRRWYQGDHYDVSKAMRERAIAHGAVPVTLRQLAMMNALRGHAVGFVPLTAPAEAERIYAERIAARRAKAGDG